MTRAFTIATACIQALLLSACEKAYELSKDRGKAEHVVLVIWDGMRPDFVSEENTPVLWGLSRRGVFFANHHPMFPSTTEVNGTVFATGVFPARSGIIGNREFRPAIDPRKAIDTQDLAAVRKGDEVTGGKHIAVPTVAEMVQQAGFRTAVAGTKAIALLQDRNERRTSKAAKDSVAVFDGKAVPESAMEILRKAQAGPFPAMTIPNAGQDRWTTRILTEELWKAGVPKFSVLWMSDPDYSQHNSAPGAAKALQGMKNSDENLGRVMDALKEKGVLDKTDVFVVSDHGFSTVAETVNVARELSGAGFRAVRQLSPKPATGDIMVVSTGALLLYVTGHDAGTTRKLVDHLQTAPFTGVIFTREAMEGTFPMSAVHIDSPDAPDVAVSMRWMDRKNESGTAGMIFSDGIGRGNFGMHGTLAASDMRNTLIAAGPDFRAGSVNEFPTGNIDVAPTILWLLGIRPAVPLDGRVLSEAMAVGKGAVASKPEEKVIEATREMNGTKWHQHLRQVKFEGVTYFIEGNGGQGAE